VWKCSLLLLLAALMLTSCKTKSYPLLEYMPDMYRQPSVHAQEYDPDEPNGIAMRLPVPGTIPRDYEPYTIAITDTNAANALVNPLQPTKDVMAAGKKYFNTYCIVCHGARGDGRGFIVPKFTMPPILYSDKVMAWPDGRIFHTMTMGQGLMPSYATQIPPAYRWAIVYYVRALQKAAHPTPQDLQAAMRSMITLDSDLPDTGKAQRWPQK
jgi:mono/diheme cytochrome c family protein